MRRSTLLVSSLALALLASPVRAQLIPTSPPDGQPAPAAERVIMDVVFWTLPVPVSDTCIELPAGQLALTVRAEGDEPVHPVTFAFNPYRNRDPDPAASIDMPVARDATMAQLPLAGGRYCYALINRADVPAGAGGGSAGPVAEGQHLAVRMVLAPQ